PHDAEVGVVESERREAAGRFTFEDDVRARDEPAELVLPARGVEVDHDAALRRVVVPPPETAVAMRGVTDEGAEVARLVTTRRLHDHDVGAEVPQHLPGPRAPLARDLHDPHTGERAAHSTPDSSRAANSSSVTPSRSQNT